MSLGGSSSKTKSKSETQKDAFDYNLTYLDPQQQANQQALVNNFMPALDTSAITQGLQGAQGIQDRLGGGMFTGNLRNIQQNLGGDLGQMRQSIAGNVPYLNQLRGQQGQAMGQLNQFAQQYNPYLNSQIQQFGQDIGRNLRENILPGIGSGAQMAGQRGGSRQGIAEGIAARGAQEQFAQGATNMRSQAYGQQQQAATALAGITGQQTMQAQAMQNQQQQALAAMGMQGITDMTGLNIQGMQGALAMYPQLAQAQLAAQLQPFQIGAGVIGAPSILGVGFGQDTVRSKSSGSGSGSGLNVGL